MTFDILIPMYKERKDIVFPLINSIVNQRNVELNDINIYIGFDGNNDPYQKDFIEDIWEYIYYSKFPKTNIHVNTFEHRGVSATRNSLFDLSTGEYVAWCDCDDSYSDINAFHRVENFIRLCEAANETKPDVIISDFWEETKGPSSDNVILCKRISDVTFVHGKFYSREYLVRENIRWNEKLTIHEDSYFNGVACAVTKNIVHLDDPLYTWCWNKDSVARRDPLYMQKTTPKYLRSILCNVEEYKARNHEERIYTQIPFTVSRVYYRTFVLSWEGQEELKEKYERYFADFWNNIKQYWKEIDPAMIEHIFAGARNEVIHLMAENKVEDFDKWIKHIESLEPLSLENA